MNYLSFALICNSYNVFIHSFSYSNMKFFYTTYVSIDHLLFNLSSPILFYDFIEIYTTINVLFKYINKHTLSGYKVYWSDGCQIRPPLDKGIADCIEQNLVPWIDYGTLLQSKKQEYQSNDNDNNNCCYGLSNPEMTTSMAQSYYQAIQSSGLITGQGSIPFQANIQPPRIAYTAMHGVGHPWAVRLFETYGLDPFLAEPEQKDADPNFPTVHFPNPEEKGALDISMTFATENGCDVVLANDPDADRLAVAERCRESGKWITFTGDQIGTMLGHWIWESLGKKSDKVSMNGCSDVII